MHWPVPSHRLPLWAIGGEVASQKPLLHRLPSGNWHLPVPSHVPVAPHGLLVGLVHAPVGAGAPSGVGVQVPSLPATLQAKQVVLQSTLQQKPSRHLPLWHSTSVAHSRPFGLGPQLPEVQVLGD